MSKNIILSLRDFIIEKTSTYTRRQQKTSLKLLGGKGLRMWFQDRKGLPAQSFSERYSTDVKHLNFCSQRQMPLEATPLPSVWQMPASPPFNASPNFHFLEAYSSCQKHVSSSYVHMVLYTHFCYNTLIISYLLHPLERASKEHSFIHSCKK